MVPEGRFRRVGIVPLFNEMTTDFMFAERHRNNCANALK